ncbi:hypothetical protein ETD83_08315 [Actinomadura soli]|uniref:ApeA N-terminal domain-containing protein n=1 Tax=Actinomadura soli TaxID=2508997 RepID=A0A5C4JH56_9ACTN|nr:hypothetical protein [Actinomadura soli]TMR04353.1 hypothetical protein ETD83_08315 [Actinomadura soli]
MVYRGALSIVGKAGEIYATHGGITLSVVDREPQLQWFDEGQGLSASLHIERIDIPSGGSLAPQELLFLRRKPPSSPSFRSLSGETFAGDLGAAERFIIHITGTRLKAQLPTVETQDGIQGQVTFALPGWTLRLVADAEAYAFVIEATPDSLPITIKEVERLEWQLFLLLSLLRGREAGLAATAGIHDLGHVVWARWAKPRRGTGQWQWCPDHLFADAFTELAQAFSKLADNPTMEKVVDRAINLYLTANGTQPIDARIPVACSGLELLAWAVLQTEQWLTTGAFSKLWAAANLRLLLQWSGIPIDAPSAFTELEARRLSLEQPDLAGPDAVLKIRNDLVHPPKRLSKLEWPSVAEMQQAWRLSMHYLELVILRILGYQGQYLPRLQLTARWATDTESVPWARQR